MNWVDHDLTEYQITQTLTLSWTARTSGEDKGNQTVHTRNALIRQDEGNQTV